MRLTKLATEDASAVAVATLGLDADAIGLAFPEAVAASLRRAASFMCPTAPGRLVDAVIGVLRPLHVDELHRDDLADLVDLLVAGGDLNLDVAIPLLGEDGEHGLLSQLRTVTLCAQMAEHQGRWSAPALPENLS